MLNKDIYPQEQLNLNPNIDPNAIYGISPASLAPVTPIQPIQVDATAPYPVAGLNTITNQQTPLSQEQEQSDIIKRTQALYNQLVGKSEFQAQQEKTQGVPELQKTQTDLSARLKSLQNEALAIPQQLQQESTGRGITTAGLQPIQTAALRNNAIQALGISSLLEASKGNLTLAQDLADRAVAQKYDPIEAQINANLKNLDLLSKDPTLTIAQQNRLTAQTAIQEKKKADVAEQKKDEGEAKTEALKYVGIADQITLEQMRKAKSALEVATIANSKGLKTLEQQQVEVNLAKSKLALDTQIVKENMGTTPKTPMVFTNTQINKGAASAEIPIADFKNLDSDSQNYFINNGSAITAKKKIIDETKSLGEDPRTVESELANSGLPPAVIDSLTKYLKRVFAKEYQAINNSIPTEPKAWWQFWK